MKIAEVMQWSLSNIVSSGKIIAVGTETFFSIAGTLLDDGGRQVIGIINTCGWIGHISTRTGHGEIFREFRSNEKSMAIYKKHVKRNITT
jgi:hypothetical protein